MPVAIIHGDADSRIPVECSKALHAGISHSQLHVIPGAEHGLMTNDAALDTRRIILDFLEQQWTETA